ncbi:MAG: hypothetical protein D3924_00395 [Candidatus Electrothrix sp. AR4]|nr:hypothetical protein [Candidatus Electrothrix sp. AR4]
MDHIKTVVPYVEVFLVYLLLVLAVIVNRAAPTFQDNTSGFVFSYIEKGKKEIEPFKEEMEALKERTKGGTFSQEAKYFIYRIIIYLQRQEVKHLLYYSAVVAGVMFTLYYGTKGIFFALAGFFTVLYFLYSETGEFSSEAWVRSILSMILFFIIGSSRETTRRDVIGLQSGNDFLRRRNKDLTADLVLLDRSKKNISLKCILGWTRLSICFMNCGVCLII